MHGSGLSRVEFRRAIAIGNLVRSRCGKREKQVSIYSFDGIFISLNGSPNRGAEQRRR
jgi:hypothetical protein